MPKYHEVLPETILENQPQLRIRFPAEQGKQFSAKAQFTSTRIETPTFYQPPKKKSTALSATLAINQTSRANPNHTTPHPTLTPNPNSNSKNQRADLNIQKQVALSNGAPSSSTAHAP